MPPKKKSGRAAAEAAYANLLSEHTALVGDVGEAFDNYVAKLKAATEAREAYEQARGCAIKAGAVTNDHLEQMGYKKLPKLPVLPAARSTAGDTAARQSAGPVEPQIPVTAVSQKNPSSIGHERALV